MSSRNHRRIAAALVLAALLAGCAHSQSNRPALSVDIRHSETENTIQVQATNLTDQPRCLRSETVRNPNTQVDAFEFRLNGKKLNVENSGYLVPQLNGVETLQPGESVTFKLNLSAQEQLLIRQSIGETLEVRVAVGSWNCSNRTGQPVSRSSWMRLTE